MDIVARPIGDEKEQCKTCSHGNARLWNAPLQEVISAGGNRLALKEMECQPTKVEVTRKIRRDGVLVGINNKERPILDRDIDPQSESTDIVWVNSCGYQLANKCRNCARLRPVEVVIPHPTYSSSTKKVVIAGACSIPTEGIEINGKRVSCAPKPLNRMANIQPSCENCKFRFTTDESWQIDDFTVNDADLTPYEMEMVRLAAGGYGPDIGRAINNARRTKAQQIRGRVHWYPCTILGHYASPDNKDQDKVLLSNGVQVIFNYDGGDIVSYTILRTTMENEFHQVIPEAIKLHRLKGNKGSLEIKLPWQAPLGLIDSTGGNDGTTKRTRNLPRLPDRIGVSYVERDVLDSRGKKIRTTRKPVQRRGEDYFAAKKPVFNEITGLVELHVERKDPDDIPISETGLWRLHLINDDKGWRVVDDRYFWNILLRIWCGHTVARPEEGPHVSVFRLRLRSLLDAAKRKGGQAAAGAIQAQYLALEGQYPLSRPYDTTPGIFRDTGLEPYKEYCSLNLAHPEEGIDFRELFGDSFGMDRTSYSRTWAYEMERDQWYRATHAGNEVHGEIMRSEMMDPAWPDMSPRHIPWKDFADKAKLIMLDPFGNEVEDWQELDEARFKALRMEDTKAYLEWLDELVPRETEDGYTIWQDRKMQVHGYTMYRGSRLEAAPNFVMDEAGDTVRDQLYCKACDKAHPMTEMGKGDYLPLLDCPDCGAEMFVGRPGGEPATWVRMGKRVGIGTAVAADSESYQNRQRLRTTVCPSWQFRYNTNITFDMVTPQKGYVEPLKPKLDKAVEDLNEFEFLGLDATFVGGDTSGGYLERFPVKK